MTALLPTSKVARRCGVTPGTVLQWMRSGMLPATRTPGGHYRFDPADVEALMYPAATTEAVPA